MDSVQNNLQMVHWLLDSWKQHLTIFYPSNQQNTVFLKQVQVRMIVCFITEHILTVHQNLFKNHILQNTTEQ